MAGASMCTQAHCFFLSLGCCSQVHHSAHHQCHPAHRSFVPGQHQWLFGSRVLSFSPNHKGLLWGGSAPSDKGRTIHLNRQVCSRLPPTRMPHHRAAMQMPNAHQSRATTQHLSYGPPKQTIQVVVRVLTHIFSITLTCRLQTGLLHESCPTTRALGKSHLT